MRKQALVSMVVLCGAVTAAGCGDDGSAETGASVETGAVASASFGRRTPPARFFVPPPDAAAVTQIEGLFKARHFADALALTALEATPRAVWFTSGTPDDVRQAVHQTVSAAALE